MSIPKLADRPASLAQLKPSTALPEAPTVTRGYRLSECSFGPATVRNENGEVVLSAAIDCVQPIRSLRLPLERAAGTTGARAGDRGAIDLSGSTDVQLELKNRITKAASEMVAAVPPVDALFKNLRYVGTFGAGRDVASDSRGLGSSPDVMNAAQVESLKHVNLFKPGVGELFEPGINDDSRMNGPAIKNDGTRVGLGLALAKIDVGSVGEAEVVAHSNGFNGAGIRINFNFKA